MATFVDHFLGCFGHEFFINLRIGSSLVPEILVSILSLNSKCIGGTNEKMVYFGVTLNAV